VSDQTENGSCFRILTLLDEDTWQCLAIRPAWSIRAVAVITVGVTLQATNTRSDFTIAVTWTDSNAISKVGTLARIADAKHIAFLIATTWTVGKRIGITCASRVVFPISFWRFIAIRSLLLVIEL
jgi:hypothetical protein